MSRRDPYDRSPPFLYECEACEYRVEAAHQPKRCPRCGGRMADLSVARE